MEVLLTFTGFHDPFFKGLVEQGEQLGPILSLLASRSFEQIFIFNTPSTQTNTQKTKAAIEKLYTKTHVEILDINLNDPTDYIEILKGLRKHSQTIQNSFPNANYFIAVASGTPQMHACWVLLAAAGEIPAHILHIRPPQFVTKDRPMVSEVNLSAKEFPAVRAKITELEISSGSPVNVDLISRQLGIIGDHPSMKAVLEMAAALAPSTVPVLLRGETGTGKEVFARLIHGLSGRPSNAFIAINCAALPVALVESILFGHKKGAFTGAVNDGIGKFDLANGGTLFLDELAELPLTVQTKLLRVLQDGLVDGIGDKKPHKVDVRVIAATNSDIGKAIKEKCFREDLYYRLNVGEIILPPLRERRSDIPKLALHILDRINTTLKKPKRLSQSALSRLQNHVWYGNIRDLENVIERSALMCRHDVIEADDLLITEPVTYADPLDVLPEPYEGFSMEEFLTSARKQLILLALQTSGGNQSKAARLLGVTAQAVHKFLQQTKTHA